MRLGSKSAFTLVEILIAMALVASPASGLSTGFHEGIPYALAGLGIGIWVAIGIIYIVEWIFRNMKRRPSLALGLLGVYAGPLVGPLLTSVITILLVNSKPLPGLALSAFALAGICDAYFFSKRQLKRQFALQQAKSALKRMELH